jgi:undecaprenyl-diphosphatase
VLSAVMLAFTEVGRGGTLWALAAIVRGVGNRRLAMAACQVVLAVTLGWIIPDAIKPLAARPRPFVASATLPVLREQPRDYSFPSGHASTAVAGAYALTATWPAARAACWVVAGAIIASRAYLGVHYPSDLLAGALLGWFIGWFVVGGTRWRIDEARRSVRIPPGTAGAEP